MKFYFETMTCVDRQRAAEHRGVEAQVKIDYSDWLPDTSQLGGVGGCKGLHPGKVIGRDKKKGGKQRLDFPNMLPQCDPLYP